MKALIVDDHPLFRAALVQLIQAVDLDGTIVQVGTAEAGIKILTNKVDATAFDVVLLDLNLPGLGGLDAVEKVVAAANYAPVVVVSANESWQDAQAAIALGARGYLLKSQPLHALTRALRVVLSGMSAPLDWHEPDYESGYEPDDAPNGFEAEGVQAVGSAPVPMGADAVAQLHHRLSDRQFAVLQLLIRGYSNREIGEKLNIVEGTVKAHLSAIFRALGVITRAQATVVARAHGLGHLTPNAESSAHFGGDSAKDKATATASATPET